MITNPSKLPALCLNCGRWFLSKSVAPVCGVCNSTDVVYTGEEMEDRVLEISDKINALKKRLATLMKGYGKGPPRRLK